MADKTSGVTLLELIIVVFIIAILATIAIPRYNEATETAKVREAVSSLRQIRHGEIIYRGEENTYWKSSGAGGITEIKEINDTLRVLLDVRDQRNWNYSIRKADKTTFEAWANRRGGTYDGEAITIDQTGELGWGKWGGPRGGE